MTPTLLALLSVAPLGGGLAVLSEAFSRRKDLMALVRHPVRPLAEHGDGFVHARGRLEGEVEEGLRFADGRFLLAYSVRVEVRSNLDDSSTQLWRTEWRAPGLRVRDESGGAWLDPDVALDLPWAECVMRLERPYGAEAEPVGVAHVSFAPQGRGAVGLGEPRMLTSALDYPDEAILADNLVRDTLRGAPPACVPPGAMRHAVALWQAVPAALDVRLCGQGRLVPDADGDRGGGYRAAPMRLRVAGAEGVNARVEPYARAEKALRLLRLQLRGGLGLVGGGLLWALAFFLGA
jgi:hypothetical protein